MNEVTEMNSEIHTRDDFQPHSTMRDPATINDF